MENPKSGHHGPEENARDGWDDTFGAFGVAGGDRALALRVARLERASGKTKSTGLVNPLGLTCVPATVSTTYAPPSRPSEPRSTRPGSGLGDARGAPGRTLRGLPGSPSFAVSSPASRSDTERPSVSEYPASIFSVACGEYRIHEAVSRTNTPTAVGLEQGLSGHISKAGGRGGGGWRARVAQTRGSRARSSLSSQKSKKEPI